MNRRGEIVIECRYDEARSFREGLAAVRAGRFYGYIDQSGRVMIRPKYLYAQNFSEGAALVGLANTDSEEADGKKREYHLIDRKGKVLKKAKARWCVQGQFSHGLARVAFLSRRNLKVRQFGFPQRGSRYKFGFIGRTLKLAISPEFDTSY